MRIPTLLAGAVLLAHAGAAQEAAAPVRTVVTYRLNFALHESDSGKRVSTKNYTLLMTDNTTGKLSVSSRVPIPAAGSNPLGNQQFTFYEAAFYVSCRLQERDGQVLLDSEVRVSAPPSEETKPGLPGATQQFNSNVTTAVAPGKPTIICDFDDLPTKRHFTLEATATKVK